jgi:hypothetical protein
VRTKRSAIAFAFGARTGVFTIPDALAAEDLVEGAAVLAVPIADQEANALLREVEAEIARLLRHHSPVGFLVQPAIQTRRLAWST